MSVFRMPERQQFYSYEQHPSAGYQFAPEKAKGLLSYMLSNPDNWDYSLGGLAHFSGHGIGQYR